MEMKFAWVTVQVSDMERSVSFYRSLLGLEVDRRMKPGPDMEIVFLGTGETKVELVRRADNGEISFGNGVSIGFVVPSLEEATATLSELGIAVYSGPFQPNPHIRFLYVLDPDGLRVQLVEQR